MIMTTVKTTMRVAFENAKVINVTPEFAAQLLDDLNGRAGIHNVPTVTGHERFTKFGAMGCHKSMHKRLEALGHKL